jgi:hypothetical protein
MIEIGPQLAETLKTAAICFAIVAGLYIWMKVL